MSLIMPDSNNEEIEVWIYGRKMTSPGYRICRSCRGRCVPVRKISTMYFRAVNTMPYFSVKDNTRHQALGAPSQRSIIF